LQGLSRRIKTTDRQAETVLEVQTTDFAICNDVKSDGFLQRDQLANACELNFLKGARAKLPIVESRSGLQPRWRPQQAAHDVSSDGV
jgi:hypothetical protein